MFRFSLMGLCLALQLVVTSFAAAAVTIEGQVVHPAQARGEEIDLSGIPVRVVWQKPEGGFGSEEMKTQAEGKFRFEELEFQRVFGLLVMDYQGISFPMEVLQLEESERSATKSIRLPLREISEDSSPVQILDLRTVIDRSDGGFFKVQQLARITNSSDRVVMVQGDDQSVLDLNLLDSHGEVAAQQLVAGQPNPAQVVVADARARYQGPVFPGLQLIELSYEIETGSANLETELEFDNAIPRFVLTVPDRRQAVYAEGLFPSKADGGLGEPERGFQYFRAYDVEPGQKVRVRIEEIPPRADGQVAAAGAIAALLFGLCIFIGLPIASEMRGESAPAVPDTPISASETLAIALQDLEHDFETGKISAEDRERLQSELYREAVREMALQRESQGHPSTEGLQAASSSKPAFCAACGSGTETGDRFCRSCGVKL